MAPELMEGRLSVFLCHASEDTAVVREIDRRLRQDGFAPWLDERQLMPGQEWPFEIEKAVRRANAIVVCLSRTSVSKEGYLQRELRRALEVAEEKRSYHAVLQILGEASTQLFKIHREWFLASHTFVTVHICFYL